MAYFQTNKGDKIYIDQDIEYTMYSPLFDDKNSFSKSFTLTETEEISIILERAGEIDARNNKVRLLEGVLVAGILQFYGILRVTTPNEYKYECNFTGQGAANRSMSNTTINKLDLGNAGITDLFTKQRTSLDHFFHYINGEKAICFPPYYNFEFSSKYPFIDNTYWPLINYFNYISKPKYNDSIGKFTPFFLVNFIVKRVIGTLGYNIIENKLDNEMFRNLLFFSNRAISNFNFVEQQYEYTIDSITVDDNKVIAKVTGNTAIAVIRLFVKMYDLVIPEKKNFEGRIVQIKEIDSDASTFTLDIDPTEISGTTSYSGKLKYVVNEYSYNQNFPIKDHMPQISLLEFKKVLENNFGLVFIPSETGRDIRIKSMVDILNNPNATDITSYAGKITDKELVPNNGFNIRYSTPSDSFYKERVTEISELYTLKEPVATISALPSSGNNDRDVRLVKDENVYYVFNEADYGSRQVNTTTNIYLGRWKFFSDPFFQMIEGTDRIEKEIKSAPLVRSIPGYQSNYHKVPRVDIAANTSWVKENTDPGIRFVFLDRLENGYPVAEYKNEYMSLEIHGPNGIYEKFYKRIFHWLLDRSRNILSHIQWPVHQLLSFRWDKKVSIKGTKYLVKSIPVIIRKNDSIEFGSSELVRT